jgi:hypothetical protein
LLDESKSIAEAFFEITYGSLSPNDPNFGRRMANVFIAISALGNVILMTYTATRVKQEIAKEAFLPLYKFFGQNYDFSIGRLLGSTHITRYLHRIIGTKWFVPDDYKEKTPVGAMLLHLLTCFVLILATWPASAYQAYFLLTGTAAYLISGVFGVFLSFGILYLRFNKAQKWNEKSTRVPPALSVTAASCYLVLNLFPVVAKWVPLAKERTSGAQPGLTSGNKPLNWFFVPVLSWCILGGAALYWLGFVLRRRSKDRKTKTELHIERVPRYEEDPPKSGDWFQTCETVYVHSKAKDFDTVDVRNGLSSQLGDPASTLSASPVAKIWSDFD